MEKDSILTAIGTITKVEKLVNVEHKIIPNTLVLESSQPFPGYHGSNLPEKPVPNSIYLVTEVKYENERILRVAKKIRESFPEKFNATIGQAELVNSVYNFIRIRNINCFDCIPDLQEQFASRGINFMKKKSINSDALIKLQKFFRLKMIDEFLFKDMDEEQMYYFEIPEPPEWDFFKKITIFIRSNIDNYSFDAALGNIYREEITDMVRIYAKDLTIEQLKFIRKKYLYEISHPDHLT